MIKSFVVVLVLVVLFFQDKISLCSPGCPAAAFVDQTGLELTS